MKRNLFSHIRWKVYVLKKILMCVVLNLSLTSAVFGQTTLDEDAEPPRLENQISSTEKAVEHLSQNLGQVQKEFRQLELDVARLDALKVDVEAIKRELSASLMDISNVLAVADRNLDAANTTLQAAEAAISASQSYLEVSAVLVTILALVASFATWRVTQGIVSRTAHQLVRKLKSNGRNGQNSIIEEIKNSVHNELYQDAVDNISFVMQDDTFREKLGELIDRAVESKYNALAGDKQPKGSKGPLNFDKDAK